MSKKPTSSSQAWRLDAGGSLIDRTKPITLQFDGKSLAAFAGDSLASALLANGQLLVGRSFKYHRPRGIIAIGSEEPNALLTLRQGASRLPNCRAPLTPAMPDQQYESQNNWPSLRHDWRAIHQLFSPFLTAGFYYKTFMGPGKKAWLFYEKFIRKAAGMGQASLDTDLAEYDHRHAHCDRLIIGGGPTGLAAARAAAEQGLRVILLDERSHWGGQLPFLPETIDGFDSPASWIAAQIAALSSLPNCRLLPHCTAFGYYDHNHIGAVETRPQGSATHQRLWTIRAKQVLLATGAIEQPLIFPGNDRPGIMLAGAVRGYINGYGIRPGQRLVLYTSHDNAYALIDEWQAAGGIVEAIIDCRSQSNPLVDHYRDRGFSIYQGFDITATYGRLRLSGLDCAPIDGRSHGALRLNADCLAISAGWQPSLHLFSQSGGTISWQKDQHAFMAELTKQACSLAGAAAGFATTAACLASGQIWAKGGAAPQPEMIPIGSDPWQQPIRRMLADRKRYRGKAFVDQQHDVTSDDIAQSFQEGYQHPELLKRYTTLGMATDQGKTSNNAGLAMLALLQGVTTGRHGTTRFRPPYTPVTIGALAGRETGRHFMPLRRTPIDLEHQAADCRWIEAGLWRRPQYYQASSRNLDAANAAEASQCRSHVGICDISTLGKFDIQGPDAGLFLDRIYANSFGKLPIGKARYGIMLREDGMVLDDGTTSRLGEQHYWMTTTTAQAGTIHAHLEYYLQAVWPDLRVHATPVTDQWAMVAVTGPNSRTLVQRLVDIDIGDAAFPFMAARTCTINGVTARLFRLSFSGERAYEIAVPAGYGAYLWQQLLDQGADLGVTPYGTEALGTLRIEKGHVAGSELTGQTTAADLGLGRMLSQQKDFIGKALTNRPGLTDSKRLQLVGVVAIDPSQQFLAGSQIITPSKGAVAYDGSTQAEGYVTVIADSPTLGHRIGLALLQAGQRRHGEKLLLCDPLHGKEILAEIVSPHFYDPEGVRLHAES